MVGSIGVASALASVLGGCGLAPPPPQTAPPGPTATARRVMLVGDSLMANAASAITEELASHRMPAVVIDHALGGWGLLTALGAPGTATKPADLVGRWIAQDDPDVVVVEFSGNFWPGQDGDDEYLSPQWNARWLAQAERLTQAVLATHTKLYWVIPPPRSSEESRWSMFHDLSVVTAQQHGGVGLVDWWTATTTSDGHWALWVDSGDGRGMIPIRLSDGLHFTPQGSRRLAEWTVTGIRPEWDAPPPSTTTTVSVSTTTTTTQPAAEEPGTGASSGNDERASGPGRLGLR